MILVYTVVGSADEAEKLAELLVEERLVACVNYFPVSSIYRWKGKVRHDAEFVLICKTISKNFGAVEKRILEEHSYECPAVFSIPVSECSGSYLRWLEDSLKK